MAGWKQNAATFLADALRLTIRACLLIDGILLALFSIWFCANFLIHTVHWLDRILFSGPW